MWRAYGGNSGVALVMNSSAFVRPSDVLKAYTSPVAYLSEQGFETEFCKVAEALETHGDFVRGLGKDAALATLFDALRYSVLCTKHPGFHEEREWRIIYQPKYENSRWMKREIVQIRGVPQPIYKIPLKDIPEENFSGIRIPDLLDRIIIGPTQYPSAMKEAFSVLLEDAGVSDAASKIFISDIPLRTAL
jgi:hypothetical protein